MLVPYTGSGDARRRPPPEQTSSLADYLRRGGRIHPVNISAPQRDEESVPLMAKGSESEAVTLMRAANRQNRCTMAAVVFALTAFILVLSGLGVLVWRVNATVDAVEARLSPHATQIVNATVDMMNDLGGSFHNMHEISDYSAQLAAVAGGSAGSATRALNSSAVIAAKLAAFMEHPTLSVSLGG